jgi:3-hydroxyisobutyrate dehydrogenase
VSGGQAGAENGILSIMVGGEEDHFSIAKPVMNSYGKTIELIGPAGSGQLAKMINQICIAGLVQGLSEGLAFGKKAKLDMEKVLQVISKGAAQSWQMENRYKTMLKNEYEFGFAVDWMRKDLSICFNEAEKNGALLPVTKIVDKYYEKVQKNGGSRYDTSSLMTLIDD